MLAGGLASVCVDFFVYLIMLYCKCGYLFEKLLDYTKSGDKHINIKNLAQLANAQFLS